MRRPNLLAHDLVTASVSHTRALRIEAGTALLATGLGVALGLAALTAARVIDTLGLASALAIYGGIAALIWRGLPAHEHRRFGAANRITLVRAGFSAILAGLGVESLFGDLALTGDTAASWRWGLAAAIIAALGLDGADGWAARRQRLASAFGARFDMEVDALLVLALSVIVWRRGTAGSFVLIAGLLRYVFLVAGRIWPVLAAPLPPSFWRKAICVFMVVALAMALVTAISREIDQIFVTLGVIGIVLSFGTDTIWLILHREQKRAKGHL